MQLTWSTNKANMKTKELSKEVSHKVVEKHHSGEGYKKISVTHYPFEYGENPLLRSERRIILPRLNLDRVAHLNSAARQAGNWFWMSL